jgi:autotransporter-associated beta strand protein
MKVCLVDSRVKESTTFLHAVQDGVTAIVIDYETDTFDSLLEKIGSVESIAYVAHGTFGPTYSFFKDSSFDMLIKADWQPFFDFLSAIDGLQFFDFLGCSLASDDRWKQVFLWIEETGVNVRASIDVTGNLASGGNWILEDGSVDAKELYFTNLDSFHGLLENSYHIVYMKGNALYGYGYNSNGQLGNGNTTNMTTETMCLFSTTTAGFSTAGFSTAFYPVQVANGYVHTVVLMSDNTIWSCGQNMHGQLGIGTTTDVNKLTKMINPSGNTTMFTTSQYPVQIACGEGNTIVLMSDNTLWGTGYNGYGQLGLNDTTSRNTLTQIPMTSIGTDVYPVYVACGQYHTMIIMSNGTIWGTGYNVHGQLGINRTGNLSILTQMKMSNNNNMKCTIPSPIKIACGNYYTVVLMSDNTIWSCGQNHRGQLGLNSINTTYILTKMIKTFDTSDYPIQIACGEYHTVVLTSLHNVWGCGENIDDQLSQNNTSGVYTLKQFTNPTNNPELFNKKPINISAGYRRTYVLMLDGTLYGCGYNNTGNLFQLADDTTVHNTISGVTAICSRSYINNVILYDGTAKPVTINTIGTATTQYFSDAGLTTLLTGAPMEPGKYYVRATINNATTVVKHMYIINKYIIDGTNVPIISPIYITSTPTAPTELNNNILCIGDGIRALSISIDTNKITTTGTNYIIIKNGTTLTLDIEKNPILPPNKIIIESGAILIITKTSASYTTTGYANIINNGLIQYNGTTGTLTFDSSISGTGSLTQTGAGILILTGNNTFTGATIATSDKLVISGNYASNSSSNMIFSNPVNTTITYSGVLSGTATLTQTGNGTLILTGANIHTGLTTIIGKLHIQNTNNITYSSIIESTGSLIKSGSGTLTMSNAVRYSGGTTINAGSVVFSGAINTVNASQILNNSNVTFNNTAALTYSAIITGSGTLTKTGAGVLTLSGINTYTGLTTISGGTLKLGRADAIPSENTITIAGDTSVLDINGLNITLSTLSVTSGLPAGCVIDSAATKGSITATTYDMANTNNTTISAKLAGSTLTKSGAGVLTLSAANTYQDTIITGGTITIGATNAITGNITIDGSTAVLNIQGYNITLGTDPTYRRLTVNNGLSNGCVIGTGTITTIGYNYIISNSSNITISAILGGNVSLIKSGAGVLTLNRANIYTRGTIINEGTIKCGVTNATTGGMTIDGPTAVLDIQGYNITFSYLTVNSGLTTALSTGCVIGTGTITADSYSMSNTNNISIRAILAGTTASLTKSGAGVLTLFTQNTYGGGTTITGGTILIYINNAISGNVTIDGPTAVLNIQTYNITLGTLTVINSLSNGCVIGTSGTITATGYTVNNTNNIIINAILGGGTLTKSGTGTLIQEIVDINTLTLNNSKTSISNVASFINDTNTINRPDWFSYSTDTGFMSSWLQYTTLSISPNPFVTFTSSTITNSKIAYLISPPCRPLSNKYVTFHFDFVNDNISTNTDTIQIGLCLAGSSIETIPTTHPYTNVISNSLSRYLSGSTPLQVNRYFVSFNLPFTKDGTSTLLYPTSTSYHIYIKFTSQNRANIHMNNFTVTYSSASYLSTTVQTINRITNITTPTDKLMLNTNTAITSGGYYVFNDKLYYNGVISAGNIVYNNILYKSGIKQPATYYNKLYYNNTWISRTIPAYKNYWNSITYGNGLFVAATNSAVGNNMVSPDGFTWTLNSGTFLSNCTSVTYGNNLFVAVSSTDGVMTSSNGIDWVYVMSLYDSWTSVTYGNNLFVAVASTGGVMASPDGINWTFGTSAANNNWTSVTFGNDRFVAVASTGTGNRVMISFNGSTWTSGTSVDNNWTSVTYGNNIFVAVASSGTNRVMTSSDGLSWTSMSYSDIYMSVAYGGGLFVIVCSRTSLTSALNKALISSDGINWTRMAIAQDFPLYCVTYGNGTFVALSLYQAMTFNYSVDYNGSSQPIDVYTSSTALSSLTYTGISPSAYSSITAPTDPGIYTITSNDTPITTYTIRGIGYYISGSTLYYNGTNVTGYYNGTLYYKTGTSNTYNGLSQPIPVIINSLVIDPLSITYTSTVGNTPINAGTYTVTADGTSFLYTIIKSDLIVTFKSVTYNGLPQSATIIESSNINITTLPSLTNIRYSSTTYTQTTTAPTNAGIYNITGDGVNINSISGTFTILKKDITVISINNITKIYDKTDTANNIGTLGGVLTGDSIILNGTYDSMNVGTNIKVTPNISNNSQNYNLIYGNYTVL